MRYWLATFLAILIHGATLAQGTRAPWQSIDPTAADALYGFRQSDHWIAEAMKINMDDDGRLGLDRNPGEPFNFDAARHLLYIVRDLNGDGRPEVFLMFEWVAVRGNSTQGEGVVMVEDTRDRWRVACSFWDEGGNASAGFVRILSRRHRGWQGFRTSNGFYGWRPISGDGGRMECFPAGNPPPRQSRAVPDRQPAQAPGVP